MIWNLDFDIAALLVCLILITYYNVRKNIPIRRNYAFLSLMYATIFVTISDIVSSIITNYPQRFSNMFLYSVNMIYYVLLAICPMAFSVFTTMLIRKKKMDLVFSFLIIAPFMLVTIITLANPFTDFVFSIDNSGVFSYEKGRNIYYIESMFYYVISCFFVSINLNSLKRRHRTSLYIYVFSLMIGHTLQVFVMPYHQCVSLSALVGLLAIFLAFENPDYYRDRSTDFFDERGLQLLREEDFMYDKHRIMAGFVIENYGAIVEAHNYSTISAILSAIAEYLGTIDNTLTRFYLGNGVFIIYMDTDKNSVDFKTKLIEFFGKPLQIDNDSFLLYPRFFYSTGDIKYSSFEELMTTLNIVIDVAKQTNGRYAVLVNESLRKRAVCRLKIENALERAITKGKLEVYYQPIFSTKEGKITSAEALVRINDDELGILLPDEFIRISERNGSITRLGEQVFEKVCHFIKKYDIKTLGLEYIEVNLSPVQIQKMGMAETFLRIIKKYDVDSAQINLEITESETTEFSNIEDNVSKMYNSGITFSLDDYGTGYSNLVNVMKLPLSIVKIDKSIAWAYFKDNTEMLVHVIPQIKNLGKKIVVEGVEDINMANVLTEMGCDYLQGFYYSEPLPEEEFVEYLNGFK
ncbi:MAG: EAL domain-containing protein [Butyrivibrio sp.]|nr:EAL domain-containing protein [Butyrivibrio sp.]